MLGERLRTEFDGCRRDVEVAEIVTTERDARRLAHRQLEPIDERPVRRIPPDTATAEERNPDVPLAVDGQAVGNAVLGREAREPTAVRDLATFELEIEDVDAARERVDVVHAIRPRDSSPARSSR